MTVRTEEITMPTPPLPLGRRIADDLIAMIKSGELRPGDPLPSARELRERYRCSITPVREAVNLLKARGWAVGQPGVAVYVADPLPEG